MRNRDLTAEIYPSMFTHQIRMIYLSHCWVTGLLNTLEDGFAVGKLQVMCTLVQTLRLCKGRTSLRWSRDIAVLFLNQGTTRGEGWASRSGRSLPLEMTRYSLYRMLGGTLGRSGEVRKISPPPGFDPRTVQPVASRYTDSATGPRILLSSM